MTGGTTNVYAEKQVAPGLDQRQMSQGGPNFPNPNWKIDSEAMPRPLRILNSSNSRHCIPEKYLSKGTDLPPSAGVPWIQIDEGNCGPKYMRGTVI